MDKIIKPYAQDTDISRSPVGNRGISDHIICHLSVDSMSVAGAAPAVRAGEVKEEERFRKVLGFADKNLAGSLA